MHHNTKVQRWEYDEHMPRFYCKKKNRNEYRFCFTGIILVQ